MYGKFLNKTGWHFDLATRMVFSGGRHGRTFGVTVCAVVAWALLAGTPSCVAWAAEAVITNWSSQCTALGSIDLTGLRDAPTQFTDVSSKDAVNGIPAYCEIQGYVSPQVGFKIGLPATDWNGKFLELGCGGDCGSLSHFDQCEGPLKRGYACLVFDAGHTGSGGLWAVNNLQAHIDFGYRGAHVAAVAGKAISGHYYNEAPRRSYFMGGSTGGRQALVEAQRFPWDFDGIVSGAPWINDTDSAMNMVWAYRALRGQDGKPIVGRAELKRVHEAALAQCDDDDGIQDGIIGNPAACRFDPANVGCQTSQSASCLTQAQVDAVRKVYDGPRDSLGRKIYVSGAAVGSEMGWVDEGIFDYIRSDGAVAGSERWALAYFRYMTWPPAGPQWKLTDFDFNRDCRGFNAGVQESLLNAGNPDLRKFKSAGGKLIIYQGWNDQSDLPQMTIDYYETVTRTMGGRAATEEFARLFLVPGMLHVTGGEGAFAIDYLSYLEVWVEQGKPPEKLIGAHVADTYLAEKGKALLANTASGADEEDSVMPFYGASTLEYPLAHSTPISFTRPIYPYPKRAKYKGRGNPNDAENFRSIEP